MLPRNIKKHNQIFINSCIKEVKIPAAKSDYEKVKKAQAKARGLAETAGKVSGGASMFSANVMDKVRSARAERGTSRLAEDIGSFTEALVQEGPEIRGRMAGVNPLQVDVMTARRRGDILGSLATAAEMQRQTQGTIEDVIGAGTQRMTAMAQIKQAEAERAAQEARDLFSEVQFRKKQEQQTFENILAKKRLELEERRVAAAESKLTGAERTTATLEGLKADIQGGATLDDVMKKYSTEVDTESILNLYNINSPYGPAKETPGTLEQRYGVKPTETALERQQATGVLESLKGLKKAPVGIQGVKLYRNQREATARFLGRMVEAGRLSDQDFESYKGLLPAAWEVILTPSVAKGKIDQAVTFIENKLGIEGEGAGEPSRPSPSPGPSPGEWE